jgi:capsular polysaccharide biosynthesis protein
LALKDLWIYFSRNLATPTEVPHGRDFSNHAELLGQLSNHGVLILDPGHHDIRALHGLIIQARGFIGIHGAGLANALLAPEGTPVIEILPHGGPWLMLDRGAAPPA